MKKIISLILVLLLVVAFTVPALADESPVVHLRLLCMNNMPTKDGTAQVVDELNRYLAEDLGKSYTVSIDEYLDLSSHQSGIDMALASGEDIGIVLTDFRTGTMAANGQLLPLDSYLDGSLSAVKDLMGEGWLDAGRFQGKLYGIPVFKGVVTQTYLIYRQDIVDEIGYDMSTVKTITDVEPLLAAVKEAHPEMDGLVPADQGSLGMLLAQYGPNGYKIDFLGNNSFGDDSTGVLFGDSKTVENFYASEAFAEMCHLSYDWAQKGLVMQEASVSPNVATELFPAGTAFGTIVWNATGPETVAAMYSSGAYGTSNMEMAAVALDSQMLTASTLGLQYGIPSTCSCPDEAVDFMNLIWTDPVVMNLIVYGLEDISYVVGEDGVAKWPEGLDVDTVPYSEINLCGAIGNQFNLKLFEGNSTAEDITLMETLIDNALESSAMGFSFDPSSVTTEVAAVQTVIDQYYYPLINGEVDPDSYIPRFVEALQNAGMEKIIAEKQAQLDAFFAEN